MTVSAVGALCLVICAAVVNAQTVLDWDGLTDQKNLQHGDVSSC